uniref:EF-hand domain-containing protein n=1 Tax=Leersia perrieri TaxID=77586 RepID=A0A0D9X1K3_9ORYZ
MARDHHNKGQQQKQQGGGDQKDAAAELAAFKTWLMQFDTDKDGKINRKELREAIRRRGAPFAGLKAWFNVHLADKNRNGVVDGDEIKHLMGLAKKDLDFGTAAGPAATVPVN